MMNLKSASIDVFIKEISKHISTRETKIINEKTIYNNLIGLNINRSKKNNFALFNKWLKHFKTYNNISVFVDPNWHFYCQFYRNAYLINEESLKIYIPLKEEGYRSSFIISLIDYLNEKNIDFIAKISSSIRNDSFLIRVNKIEDIDIIINYIESNNLYKQLILNCNPFLINYRNFGICFDGILNYNLEVSLLISKYINTLAKTDDYENASYEGFKIYAKEILKAIINNDEFAQEYIEDRLKLTVVKVNKSNITKILKEIIISLDEENFNEFIYLYEQKDSFEDDFFKSLTTLEKAVFDTFKIKGLLQVKAALSKYVSKNDCGGFTRAKGSRLALFMFTNNQMAKQEIKKVNIDLKTQDAIKLFIEKTKNKAEKYQDELLEKAILISLKKYGNDWSIKKYLAYLLEEDYSIFTREQEIRKKISYLFYPQDFIATMKRKLEKHNYSTNYLKKDKIIEIYEELLKKNL